MGNGDPNSTYECGLYKPGNQSDPFHLGNPYGGIPTNLITNGIGWALLMLLFIFIRKSAFRFLKIQSLGDLLVNKSERSMNKLIQVFFSQGISSVSLEDGVDNKGYDESPGPAVTIDEAEDSSDADKITTDGEGDKNSNKSPPEQDRQTSLLEEGDTFWGWLAKAITMPESRMLQLAGPDGVQYLRFQLYLIAFMVLTTLFCICIILPLNFQGHQQGGSVDFGHTTLANLNPDSWYLYFHIVIAFILFPISIMLMRRFSVGLNFRDAAQEIRRSIQVENIPKHLCKEDLLLKHFNEAYPTTTVVDIKIAFDVSKLTGLSTELQDAEDARKYGESYKSSHNGRELKMVPVCSSRCCSCFCTCCVDKVEVIEFFSEEEARLRQEVEKQRELSLHSPLGMAFVTFSSLNESRQVQEDHSRSKWWCGTNPPLSSLSTSLRPDNWRVNFAHSPKDIYWENLSDARRWLITKSVIANVILLIVALFLTTPEYIVSQLDSIILAVFDTDPDSSWQLPPLIKDFLPTIMLWSFTALLPVLVAYSDRWLGHWYRSEENHSIMIKTFWYLWVIVLIFPTFGFTTGMALLENLFNPTYNSTEPTIRWDCIFLPDSGAFFVNYVITAAFIGSGLELLRFPELFWYALQMCFSRSEAESRAIQRAVVYEFRFGEQYARMLLIFSMVVMYCMSCPLITPFGLVYFVFKHFVDKHNLAFVYAPSKINKSVHRSAINFVIFSVTLLQVFMVIFSFIRSYTGNLNELSTRTKISFFLFILTLMIFSAQIWSDLCRKMSPIKYVDVLYSDDASEEVNQEYVPEVLKPFYHRSENQDVGASITTAGADNVLNDSQEDPDGIDVITEYGTFVKDLVDIANSVENSQNENKTEQIQ